MFFTSDWHLYHKNVIRYCNRPFKNIDEMHKVLINNHNSVVGKDDIVWNLGDVTMASTSNIETINKSISKFNGIHHLIVGNHDDWKISSYEKVGFLTIHNAMWFKHDSLTFYLAHDPSVYNMIESDKNNILLCGHVHNLFKHLLPEKRVINVGIDVWNFFPVHLNNILELLNTYNLIG